MGNVSLIDGHVDEFKANNGASKMIILTQGESYFIGLYSNLKDLLFSYAHYTGHLDLKILKILLSSNEMTVEELVEYINRFSPFDDQIMEIYEIGKKLY